MSVIWSGVTEEGAVVPVQVTDEGKVVAVGDGPEGDYLKLTGGNLTGDLTVNEQITLATDGNAEFGREVVSARFRVDGSLGVVGDWYSLISNPSGDIIGGWTNFDNSFKVGGTLPSDPNISLNADGSADFYFQSSSDTFPVLTLRSNLNGSIARTFYHDANGTTVIQPRVNLALLIGNNAVNINNDGSATFSGDVVIGSRGEKWLIRESNGVAMLVQQTLRGQKEPRMEKLRDLPNELDLIEAALNEIMAKLRMTPPAGWPVWDGSDNA